MAESKYELYLYGIQKRSEHIQRHTAFKVDKDVECFRIWSYNSVYYYLLTNLIDSFMISNINSHMQTSANYFTFTKGPFKRIRHVGQTLSNIVRWCWTVFDQCWVLECSKESNIIKQCWISVPGTKLWRIFENVEQC